MLKDEKLKGGSQISDSYDSDDETEKQIIDDFL